jgi:hypothetical protein
MLRRCIWLAISVINIFANTLNATDTRTYSGYQSHFVPHFVILKLFRLHVYV